MNPKESNREIEVVIERKRLPRRLRRTDGPAPPRAPRVPRITRLMALAIKFQNLIDRGEVKDYTDLARLGHVSRARITQIRNLLNLAPEIQERLLFGTESGGLWDSNFSEARLRFLVRIAHWDRQRIAWSQLVTEAATGGLRRSQARKDG